MARPFRSDPSPFAPSLFALALCALAPAAHALAPVQDKKALREASSELRRLHEEDQADQRAWSEGNDAEFSRRQDVRRARALELVNEGLLLDPEAWDHAAILLQHGSTPEDYLLAQVLSMPPGAEDLPFGRFMSAATLDRFLHAVILEAYGAERASGER